MNNILDFDFQYNGGGELEVLEDTLSYVNYPDRTDASSGWRLDVTAKINNDGDLEIYDTTPYEQWDIDGYLGENNTENEPRWKFVVIDRVVLVDSDDPKLIIWKVTDNVTTVEGLRNNFITDVPGNGLYHYQKLIIPYESNITSSLERLYYANNKIYHVDSDNQSIEEFEITSENFDDIFDLVTNNQFNNTFYFSSDTFSAYDLIKCYVLKERAQLNNYFRNGCKGECDKHSKATYELDVLLAAIIIIDHFVNTGNYFEAQRILNELNTCGGLCKDIKNNLKGCGCERNY